MRFKLLSKDFLGERHAPELEAGTIQHIDHLRRYLFAQQYVYGRRVLDVACGTGYGSDLLQRGRARRVISADLSRAALDYARAHWPDGRFVRADAARLPLPSGAFDVVVSFETIEHLPDPRAFLAEARRVLQPEGRLILSTPNRAVVSPGSDAPFSPYHTFEPTRDDLLALLAGAGWRVLELYGMIYSPQAQPLVRPATGPYPRASGQIAWAAYLRTALWALLPPLIARALCRVRGIPTLAIGDSILAHGAPEGASYFVALCAPQAEKADVS